MTVTFVDEGMHTPPDTNGHLIVELAPPGVYIVRFAIDVMQNGDTLRIWASGQVGLGPQRIADQTYTDAQDAGAVGELIVVVDENDNYDSNVLLQQSTGTGRNYYWRAMKIGG